MRALKDWIRRVLLRKTATPYECYWRDRALKAEAKLKELASRQCDYGHMLTYCALKTFK